MTVCPKCELRVLRQQSSVARRGAIAAGVGKAGRTRSPPFDSCQAHPPPLVAEKSVDGIPGTVRVVFGDGSGNLCRVGPNIFLVDNTVLMDDEGHDAGVAILGRVGQECEAARKMPSTTQSRAPPSCSRPGRCHDGHGEAEKNRECWSAIWHGRAPWPGGGKVVENLHLAVRSGRQIYTSVLLPAMPKGGRRHGFYLKETAFAA